MPVSEVRTRFLRETAAVAKANSDPVWDDAKRANWLAAMASKVASRVH